MTPDTRKQKRALLLASGGLVPALFARDALGASPGPCAGCTAHGVPQTDTLAPLSNPAELLVLALLALALLAWARLLPRF